MYTREPPFAPTSNEIMRIARPLFPTLLLAVLVGLTPTSRSAQDTAAQGDRTVILVRHGETCTDQGRDPKLSSGGQKRARDLARTLTDVPLDVIYSTPLQRTLETAAETALQHDLVVQETPPSGGFLARLAGEIKTGPHRYILVSGHSNTTPALVNELAGTNLENLSETMYDRMYIVTLREDSTATVLTLHYGDPSGAPSPC